MLSREVQIPQFFGMLNATSGGKIPAHTEIFPVSNRVLVVDDEALIRWFVAEGLEGAGYRVLEAGSAAEALSYFQDTRDPVPVVLLDLKLPDSHDLGLLRLIHERCPTCRIILMTAHGTPELLEEALRLGAFRVLGKPFDLSEALGLIREAAAA
jgi:DNA-binding NtrC family response regulator